MINKPLISVIMPCYNRENYIISAIESILNQTYSNFEFIIIDDCSTDNTFEIVKHYANLDKRIIPFRNDINRCYVYSLNFGLNIAKGKYIARMDDDDISLPSRFEKQVKYLEENEDIVVLGTYIEFLSKNNVFLNKESDPDILSILLNFYCVLAHPSVMIRKSFLDKHQILYDKKYQFAEDYNMWSNILKLGGKIANYPEVLLRYRLGEGVSRNRNTQIIQSNLTRKIQIDNLSKYFDNSFVNQILERVISYPFDFNNIKFLFQIFNIMKVNDKNNSLKYDKIIEKYCGNYTYLNIAYCLDGNNIQQICVSIASILSNSTDFDSFCFYLITKNTLTDDDLYHINYLRNIKDFELKILLISELDIIDKNKKLIKNIDIKYYFLFIPFFNLKLDKILYLNSDTLIEDSLNLLYNLDLKDNYFAATPSNTDNSMFNYGVILFNLKKNNLDILNKLFLCLNIFNLKLSNDEWFVSNIVNFFDNNWIKLSYRYNLYDEIINDDTCNLPDIYYSRTNPTIIYFNINKPYNTCKINLYWWKYWEYIRLTSFNEYYYTLYDDLLNDKHNKVYGAVDIVKNQLSYRIGRIMINSNKIHKILIIPFKIVFEIIKFKIEQKIYYCVSDVCPSFRHKSLEDYDDYHEACKVKQHLSYKLGNAFVKNPFLFVFKIYTIYRDFNLNRKSSR
ncbi:glycosyltransferase family 2 protein [Campylobacter volucris]|uniref:glycosyltransferase family 2 protein n=1 Tax=Campylobacter volucris TaxID=1031542 RepID=UPI00140504AC|nr:glycosyltransferase family 2 protein [Campylobacter volucris]